MLLTLIGKVYPFSFSQLRNRNGKSIPVAGYDEAVTTADQPGDGQAPAPADGQPLRRDAERNRERIAAAARGVFAADGIEASMASVARAAGVGIATLFRRFPTREDLIGAVFADTMNAYVAAVTPPSATPTPGTASPPTSTRSAPCRPPIAASPKSSP